MDASIGIFVCYFVGSTLGYNIQREFGYNNIPNDLYSVGVNPNNPNNLIDPEYSQRLFWGNQGSNQVGGTGLWATLTNKFPFLASMFGRMQLPSQYGPPSQFDVSPQYGLPQGRYQQQLFRSQQLAPAGRDVTLTDDAVIVTPPFVPIFPAPAPAPAPVPAPAPAPDLASGYQYKKPVYRLELPRNH